MHLPHRPSRTPNAPVQFMDEMVSLDYPSPHPRSVASPAMEEGRSSGTSARQCGQVYVPPRGFCPLCVVETDEARRGRGRRRGTVTSFTVLTPIQYHGQEEREDTCVAAPRRRRHHRRPSAHRRHSDRRGAHGHAGRGCVAAESRARRRTTRAAWGSARDQPLGADRRARCHPRASSRSTFSERDVAIVSFAQAPSRRQVDVTETQMLFPVVTEAFERPGIHRREIGFTCSGSADYLAGAPFAFVQPRGRRRVAADLRVARRDGRRVGAVRGVGPAAARRHRHRARRSRPGISSRRQPARGAVPPARPVLPVAALGRPRVARRAPGPALLDANGAPRATSPRSSPAADATRPATRTRRCRATRPPRAARGALRGRAAAGTTARRSPTVPPRSCSSPATGPGRCASGPAWIRGHRPPRRPALPGRARPYDVARRHGSRASTAGVGDGPVEVAELLAPFSHEELILRDALGLGDDVDVNPSGGALAANPMMVSGLIRIGEAFRQINEQRQAPHASATPRRARACSRTSSASWRGTEWPSGVQSSASARRSTRRSATTCRSPGWSARRRCGRSTTPRWRGATSTRS